jgi:hypothetical protein
MLLACCQEQNTEPDSADDSGSWETIGADLAHPVTSLCIQDQRLLAATIERRTGQSTASIWSWHDSTWMQITPPLDGQVDVMKVHRGALIAGGWFEVDGGQPIRGLAQWSGASWQAVGDPLEEPDGWCRWVHVSSMTLWRDRLLIGGWFNNSGNLAAWDGAVLEAIPCSLRVDALTVWRDMLLVGGGFCGDVQCPSVSGLTAWDGLDWSDFANWMNLVPADCPRILGFSSLLASDDGVIVTGTLPEFEDPSIEKIALWTGDKWQPMGSVNGHAGLLSEADDHLLVVATETDFGPSQILRWESESWIPIGPALDGCVTDLVVFDGSLIVGGDFTGSVARMPLARFAE